LAGSEAALAQLTEMLPPQIEGTPEQPSVSLVSPFAHDEGMQSDTRSTCFFFGCSAGFRSAENEPWGRSVASRFSEQERYGFTSANAL
jgi:hypothetical protein